MLVGAGMDGNSDLTHLSVTTAIAHNFCAFQLPLGCSEFTRYGPEALSISKSIETFLKSLARVYPGLHEI